MAAAPLYLDSSGLVKLVLPEAESAALRAFLRAWPRRTSSALAAAEVPRAVQRATSDPAMLGRAAGVLADIVMVAITDDVLRAAARLPPVTLRALDAVHLATALSLGNNLGGIVAYDERLAEAARSAGLSVFRPR
ncbi:MAG: type II toxin-antitoxin system VapC family toxin [Chloroflexota bacterium]